MRDNQSSRIFISYSRKDAGEFAVGLGNKFRAGNLSLIWQDIVALERRRASRIGVMATITMQCSIEIKVQR